MKMLARAAFGPAFQAFVANPEPVWPGNIPWVMLVLMIGLGGVACNAFLPPRIPQQQECVGASSAVSGRQGKQLQGASGALDLES